MNTINISDALITEMKECFANDHKRIDHAVMVLGFAKHIQALEGGDKVVIDSAAILHDIGIKAAEQKYNSSAGTYQEIEGPAIAREILERKGVDNEHIEHICMIIANHHSAKCKQTQEFKVIWDADWLVNIGDEIGLDDKEKLAGMIGKIFKTQTGRQMAEKLYLNNEN